MVLRLASARRKDRVMPFDGHADVAQLGLPAPPLVDQRLGNLDAAVSVLGLWRAVRTVFQGATDVQRRVSGVEVVPLQAEDFSAS